jgi:hypothetical protein
VSLTVAIVLMAALWSREATAQTRFLQAPGRASASVAADGVRQRVLRSQPMTAALAALPTNGAAVPAVGATRLEIELFDGRVVAVRLDAVGASTYGTTFTGVVEGAADSRFAGVRVEDAFVADLSIGGEAYELRHEGAALLLHQVDATMAVPCATIRPPDNEAAEAGEGPAVGVGSWEWGVTAPLLEPWTVDVLVAYTTPAQAGAGGASGAQALADLTIQQVNAALARSLVSARFRVARVIATPVTEEGSYAAQLGRVQQTSDGVMDDVPSWREAVDADIVVLVAEGTDPGGYAGLAYQMAAFSKREAAFAYSINLRRQMSAWLVGHEMGHTLGLAHDRNNASGSAPFRPYAYGYQVPGHFGTLMAYSCFGCRPIDYYSNPAVLFEGVPTGVADYADEARALRENFPMVASYRGCSVAVPYGVQAAPGGGLVSVSISAGNGCYWSFTPPIAADWLAAPAITSGYGPTTLTFTAAPLPQGVTYRESGFRVDSLFVSIVQRASEALDDDDADGLTDTWERQFGLDDNSATGDDGADGDPDHDGVTNAQERAAGTHPRGFHTRYLAEGSANAFFKTQLAIFNPGSSSGVVVVRLRQQGRAPINLVREIYGYQRLTINPEMIAGFDTDFATVVESSMPLVVDRTMTWDGNGYGSHAETSVASPSTTWYLAEGSTSADFALFYLLQNPGATPAAVTVRYLLPFGQPPIDRTYTLAADSRLTIPVDSVAPELASTDVSAVVTSSQPIIVERAMYLDVPGQPFAAGHESAGVTVPATSWFLAEGATGAFFDLFVLLSNPSTSAAEVDVDYLLSTGATYRKHYSLPAQSRSTIWVDDEQIPAGSGLRPLAGVNVSTTVTSTNGVPIIVERTMWWPGPEVAPTAFWREAHNSAGATATGTVWALAEGEVGGTANAETFILIANTSAQTGSVRITLHFEGSGSASRLYTVAPHSRTTVNVSTDLPTAAGKRFGAIVESQGTTPAPIVVERAMYTSPGGQTWAAGTNALATRLQ